MKKLFVFIFVSVLALFVVACNPTSSTTSTSTTATTVSSATTVSTTSTATTTTTSATTTSSSASTTSTTTTTTTTTTTEVVLSFSSIAFVSGTNNGELLLNIAKANATGTIYYVVVPEGSVAPTAAQIIAGVNYGDVTVASAGNGATFANHVISGFVAGNRYTLHTVISFNTLTSVIRSMTATAKLVVVAVDKGEGTLEDPFQISTVQDLEQIGKGYYTVDEKEWNMDSHYVLMNDIDLTAKYGADKLNWAVLGGDSAGNRFAGVLDGNGFSILGLYIGQSSTAGVYRGFFASSEPTALVKNLTFVNPVVVGAGIDESNPNHGTGVLFGYFKGAVANITILNATVSDTGTRIGGLAGRSYETGHVSNTYVSASVQGQNRVGGLVGVVDVADATALPVIYDNVVFVGSVIGSGQYVGGLVGYLRGVQMSNVIVAGYIQGAQEVGGVAGFFQKRAGNNQIAASIQNAIVYATVYGTSSSTTIGVIVGQVSTSNITPENQHLLQVSLTYLIEGAQAYNGGDPKAINGTLVSLVDIASPVWFAANLPGFDFVNDWEFKLGASRPSLIGSLDTGDLGVLTTPLVLIPTFTEGPEEKQITVRITANKPETTIYYVVLASGDVIPTAAELKNPSGLSGVLFSGNGSTIQEALTMADYATTYHVFYYAEHASGNSNILKGTIASKAMTPVSLKAASVPDPPTRKSY
ncbi:MAG: hypothetical protein MZU97_26345 [Bacillus subtilis]|nr:hypothetical protein [Bacillus subtilis]